MVQTSYEWVEPIKKAVKEITPSDDEARTSDLLIEKNQNTTKNAIWYTVVEEVKTITVLDV